MTKQPPLSDDIVAHPQKVFVLASTQTDMMAVDEYLAHTRQEWKEDGYTDSGPNVDALCEFAGRMCYQSFDKPRPGGSAAYFDNIKKQGHGSILEHASVTFALTGASRNLTHELVRHRAGFGFSQLSQRYVDAANVKFVPPYDIWEDGELIQEWRDACMNASISYNNMIQKLSTKYNAGQLSKVDTIKHMRQCARSVLPGCTETHITVTANLRAWRHFLHQRGSPGAEVEIRMLACKLVPLLKSYAPHIFEDVRLVESGDGVGMVAVDYSKV